MTKIEWTEATWNPVVGCSVLSPGCTNCYAMQMAARIEAMNQEARETERSSGKKRNVAVHYDGTTKKVNGKAVWTGKLAMAPDAVLLQPLKRKKPTTYFVNSMGDPFHENCPDEWIDRVFAVMALSPQHTFQVLTKRAERMFKYMTYWPQGAARQLHIRSAAVDLLYDRTGGWSTSDPGYVAAAERTDAVMSAWPLPNVWLGVSTERQKEADERLPLLLQTPAAVRFISAEPLLGPIRIFDIPVKTGPDRGEGDRGFSRRRLDWVIVGGESGHDARPMSIQWARELRDQCHAQGIPFFFKQWGEWHPAGSRPSGTVGRFAFGDYEHDRHAMIQVDGYPRQFTMFGARALLERVGKKAAGRLLDGITHDAMPGATERKALGE